MLARVIFDLKLHIFSGISFLIVTLFLARLNHFTKEEKCRWGCFIGEEYLFAYRSSDRFERTGTRCYGLLFQGRKPQSKEMRISISLRVIVTC